VECVEPVDENTEVLACDARCANKCAEALAWCVQALADAATPEALPGAWELCAYYAEHEVVLERDGRSTTCRAALPCRFDGSEPEAVAREWLGARLHGISRHMRQFRFADDAPPAVHGCARALGSCVSAHPVAGLATSSTATIAPWPAHGTCVVLHSHDLALQHHSQAVRSNPAHIGMPTVKNVKVRRCRVASGLETATSSTLSPAFRQ
jgi:hypothetical protein